MGYYVELKDSRYRLGGEAKLLISLEGRIIRGELGQ